MIATKPIDFRKGADGLVALVRETLGQNPFSGCIHLDAAVIKKAHQASHRLKPEQCRARDESDRTESQELPIRGPR